VDLLDRRDAILVGAGNVFTIYQDIPGRVSNAMHGHREGGSSPCRKRFRSGKLWARPSSKITSDCAGLSTLPGREIRAERGVSNYIGSVLGSQSVVIVRTRSNTLRDWSRVRSGWDLTG